MADRTLICSNFPGFYVSKSNHDTSNGVQKDRRLSVRRKEDFFWLKQLSDLTDEACIVVDETLSIQYVDEKVFKILNMPLISSEVLTELSQLTSIMAEQGYFGTGDPKVFEALISDLLVNQRLKQTASTQIINAITPSGRHVDIRVSLGRDKSYLILIRDITEEQLKKRAFETALKTGQSGYWYYNIASKEFRVRADSLEESFSVEKFRQIKSEGFLSVVHPDDAKGIADLINDVIRTSMPGTNVSRIMDDFGNEHWFKSHIMPNVDEAGKVRFLSCFFTNISQQMRTEIELRDAQSKAELALKAKNEFLGRLSHEVRTPMNAVIGMADALVHNCDDPEILPQLALIQNSAEKVMELVDSTLEHTKLADDAVELNLHDGSPAEVVESVCKKWQDKARDNNTSLSFTIHPDVPATVEFDDYRYEQCLSNLLSNAIKFTPGGNIKVLLAPNGEGENRHLILAVKDNGIGMSKESQSKIFLPFTQADKSISGRFGGTGLGLSIVKDLVDLMGGRINVKSEPEKGTVFAIALPMPAQTLAATPNATPQPLGTGDETSQTDSERQTSPTPSAISAVPAPHGTDVRLDVPLDIASDNEGSLIDQLLQNEKMEESRYGDLRVLIVDDNATNHIVVSSLLSRVVGQITTALNGQEALEKLKEKQYDLVLMDIHMPIMDGIETTLAIRSQPSDYQNVPIIALTADPQYQQARLCRNIGMNSSLGKPIKLTGLLQAFDEVLFPEDEESNVASAA